MLKLVSIFALFFLNPTLAPDQDNQVGRLRDVNTVYVAELGQSEKAKALRQEIMRKLIESKRITLVEAADKADAVLSVSITSHSRNVDSPYEAFGVGQKMGSRVINTAGIVFRLNSHQNRTLWSHEFDSANSSANNETQAARALGKTVSRKFLKAVESDRKKQR